MGNNQTKHSIMRSSSMIKTSPAQHKHKKSKTKLSKSATMGYISENAHEDLLDEEKSSIDNSFKRFSCFNFANCHPDSKNDMKFQQNLISENASESDIQNPVRLRGHQQRNLLSASSSLFFKVRQRIVNMNRRSNPVNLNESARESVESVEPVATSVVRSMTDYNIVKINADETTGLITNENLLKKRKFGNMGKFTKSPALYDIQLYANEDPDLGTKKISDLLEEEEANVSYDEYDDTYNTDFHDLKKQNLYENANCTYTGKYNRSSHFRPSHSLDSSTSYSTSNHSNEHFNETACPFLQNPDQTNQFQNRLAKAWLNREAESIIFIDDGQSEYLGNESSNVSKTSSMPSLIFSSFKCSLNNLNRLILNKNERTIFNDLSQSSSRLARDDAKKYIHFTETSKELSESEQFIDEVNRKLIKYADSKNSMKPPNKSALRTLHSESVKNNEISVDISRNYEEQFNDNISIFNHINYRKAPLAASETTTLSSSNDNLLGMNSNQFRMFNPKYPLVSQLVLSQHHQYLDNFNIDNNNNNF